jgi:hypothetical protein
MRKFTRSCRFLLVATFLSSCSPTYPQEKVVDSLVALCKEEYKTEIQATINATTIGVLVPVDGLFEVATPGMSEEDLRRISEGLPFSKGALDKIEVASRSLSRVVLSTDASLEFYTVVTRDLESGVEFLWSGYITDLKRLNYLDISQGDFLKYRTPIALRIQPERIAKKTVENFFRDLGSRSMVQILRRNVSGSSQVEEILASILQFKEAGLTGTRALRQGTLSAAEVAPGEVVVWAAFSPEEPLDAPRVFLFHVEVSEVKGLIREIERLPDAKALPARYHFLGPPETWDARFWVAPFSLPEFLADQIARRTRLDMMSAPPAIRHPREVIVEGNFRARSFDFKFHSLETAQPTDDTARAIVKTAAEVLHSYRFGDFERLVVTDAFRGTQWVVPAKELPLYRRRNSPALQPLH